MILSFLNKPYPYLGKLKKNLFSNFIIGCFIAFFLIVFQPFDINEWDTPNKIAKLLGFGLVSFLAPVLVSLSISLLVPQKILEDNWRIWTEIFTISIILCLIAFGNMLYGNWLGAMPLTLKNYPGALLVVLTIGVFPVTLHVILKHNKLLKINYEQALMVNSKLSQQVPVVSQNDMWPEQEINELVLVAENDKDKLSIPPAQLLYIESADNYSNVVYAENGRQKKQLIRSSLKRIESQLIFKEIVRCHRAYIVNITNVKKIEGNAAGYRLTFSQSADSVPVSRTYAPAILQQLGTR